MRNDPAAVLLNLPASLHEFVRGSALGAFEGFSSSGALVGWVCALPSNGAEEGPLRVTLQIEDLLNPGPVWPIAEVSASLPRADRLELGLSANCGFVYGGGIPVELPPRSTGLVLRVRLVADPSQELAGSPLRINENRYHLLEQLGQRVQERQLALDPFQAPFLSGRGIPGESVELRLDGEPLPPAPVDEEGRFRVSIPPQHCDGNAHHLSLHDSNGELKDEQIAFTPFQITPWAALLEHGQAPFPDKLNPLALEHHRCLTTWLAWADADGTPLPPDLPLLQRLLSSPLNPPVGASSDQEFGPQGNPVARVPIHLPLSQDPLVSVVVPIHNKYSITRRCLAALAYAPTRVPFELVVVDDGSTDGSADFLAAEAPGVIVVRHDYARGFNQACHSGVAASRAPFVVLLNNDTEPCCQWLEELLDPFERWSDTGLVGAQLIYPDGRLQEAGGIVWGNGEAWNYGRGLNPHHPGVAYGRQVDYVSGAALAIPRELWNQLGGFSPEFSPAYYEDTDLAFKVRAAGHTVRYAPLARVIHHEGLSCGTQIGNEEGLKRFQALHGPQFQRKWRDAFSGCKEPSQEAAETIKDRGILGRALFLDHGTPRPDRDAGSHAALVEMELVASLGYKVTFLPSNLAWLGRYTEELQRRGIEAIHAPFVLSLESFLRERGVEFDFIYLTRYTTVRDSLPQLRAHAPQARLIFCNADLHYLRELRQARAEGLEGEAAVAAFAAIADTRREELDAIGAVDLTLTYSEVEQAVIEAESLGRVATALCPWVVKTAEQAVALEQRHGLAFLGSYQHPPNRDGIESFLSEVWSTLRGRFPDLELHLYGSGMEPELERRWSERPGVRVHGWIQDAKAVFERHRVFIAPLRAGAGLKGKVIAALAQGIPQVLSPMAAEATGLRHGVEVFIAKTPEQWVQSIGDLVRDDALWLRCSRAALVHSREHHSLQRGLELMAEALGQLGLPLRAPRP
ncbi:MAG: glycosyltransferase [Prochlorococcaceae cyanobacterium]